MKKFFALLIMFSLVSLSFAAWQEIVGLAILASFGLLVIIYMIAFGFGLDNMKMMAKDEMMQLLITAVLAASLIGAATFMDGFTNSIVELEGGSGKTMQQYAIEDILKDSIITDMEDNYNKISVFGMYAMYESSKSHFCTFMSTGLFISSCNSYSLVSPPLSLAMQAMAIAFVEMQSLSMLIEVGYRFAFAVFLPVGLFLRSLKISRGAGALFIALGVTFYFILPLTVIFLDDLDEYYQEAAAKDAYDDITYPAINALGIEECAVTSTGSLSGAVSMDNPEKVIRSFENSLFPNIDAYVYQVFVRVNITLFVSIFVMATAVRWLTSLFGAEVDISAISRLA